jgi:hypothetical protein
VGVCVEQHWHWQCPPLQSPPQSDVYSDMSVHLQQGHGPELAWSMRQVAELAKHAAQRPCQALRAAQEG